MLAFDTPAALEVATDALAMAEAFGLDELRADTLITIGAGLANAGQAEGIERIREGLGLALASNALHVAMRAHHNIGATVWPTDHVEANRHTVEASRIARRVGGDVAARYPDAMRVANEYYLGNWDESVGLASAYLANSKAGHPPTERKPSWRSVRCCSMRAATTSRRRPGWRVPPRWRSRLDWRRAG